MEEAFKMEINSGRMDGVSLNSPRVLKTDSRSLVTAFLNYVKGVSFSLLETHFVGQASIL